ncbi:MAG: response regulator [Pseudomonadota bacterium]
MTEMQTIHLVDDEDSIRRSAGFMLRTSGYEVETYASGIDFLKDVKAAVPGCILLDVRMPGMDGLEVQAELNRRGVAMPVIVLTGHGDTTTAVTAMKAGAVDFLEKPFEKAMLLEAIDAAFHRLNQTVDATAAEREAKVRIAALTRREQDVLRGLVRGHPNKTVAYDLGISPRTVEVYRANLMSKLGVRSLSEALRLAFTAGLEGVL